jgi:hypothetical protein
MKRIRLLALVYLYLVPIVVAAIGFGIKSIHYKTYVPLWLIHVCLTSLAITSLSRRKGPSGPENKALIFAAVFLLIPWLLFSIFAGMGPPPATPEAWLAKLTEQQLRYSILIGGGLSALLGFAILRMSLKGGRLFASLGFTLFSLALPLFVLNMAYWGFYLPEAFRSFLADATDRRPDWYLAVRSLFYVISCIEVALIYLSTIFFAMGLREARMLSDSGCRWYQIFGMLGAMLLLVPPSWPDLFSTLSYFAAIPAIPFVMPYLMGIQVLKKSRNADN